MAEPVTFSVSLYTREAIDAAVAAFAELATFELGTREEDITVSVTDIDPELEDVLIDEFCNYALHETIVRARG